MDTSTARHYVIDCFTPTSTSLVISSFASYIILSYENIFLIAHVMAGCLET